MSRCAKRCFNTPGNAKAWIRVWQQRGRRSALDTVHVYKCEHPEHRGRFHVGHTHVKPGQSVIGRPRQSSHLDELDDLFREQEVRVRGVLSKAEARLNKRRRMWIDDGELIRPTSGTWCPEGDEFDVENR